MRRSTKLVGAVAALSTLFASGASPAFADIVSNTSWLRIPDRRRWRSATASATASRIRTGRTVTRRIVATRTTKVPRLSPCQCPAA
jgi:hypothetical protein